MRRINDTRVDRYGCYLASKNDAVKQSISSTCYARYGVRCGLQTDKCGRNLRDSMRSRTYEYLIRNEYDRPAF
jgi:hypothetical protein